MRIRFRQSGGVVGLTVGCDLDQKSLDVATADELRKLVDASRISGDEDARSAQARDAEQFEITIDPDDARKTVTAKFDRHTLPDAVKPLVRFLRQRATPKPPD